MTPEEQNAILRAIGEGVLAVAPPGWAELRYTLSMTAEVSAANLEADLQDSTTVPIKPPEEPRLKFRELRSGMYRPGRGTWFGARFVIVHPGRYTVDFDYDSEPVFGDGLDFKPVPMTYVNDLKLFPRDEEHVPGWLRLQIEEAGG
jgi:hypothetical protein